MSVVIEARAYGPDSSAEEIEALRDRVSFYKGIAGLFHEVPVGSEFHVKVCFGRVDELLRAHDCDKLIIDLSGTSRPTAAVREKLRAWCFAVQDHLPHIYVFTGRNFLVNVAARFVMAGIPQKVTVRKTLSEVEEAIGDGE
jgi:hypothetical protein